MEKDIVFVDIYGNKFNTYQEISNMYNVKRKTLTSRKIKTVAKGFTNVYAIIDKCLMDYSDQYKKDWDKLASEDRKAGLNSLLKPVIYIDIYGNKFDTYTGITAKYNLPGKYLACVRTRFKKEIESSEFTETAVIDYCLINKNDKFKTDYSNLASIERKNELYKITKNEELLSEIKNDTNEKVNEKLKKRVEDVNKLLAYNDIARKLCNDETDSIIIKVIDTLNKSCEQTIDIINKANINTINEIKEVNKKTVDAISSLISFNDVIAKPRNATKKPVAKTGNVTKKPVVSPFRNGKVKANPKSDAKPSNSSKPLTNDGKSSDCAKKSSNDDKPSDNGVKTLETLAKIKPTETIAKPVVKPLVETVVIEKPSIKAIAPIKTEANCKGEIFDTINVKKEIKKKSKDGKISCVKPEIEEDNIFYQYVTELCTADDLLKIYRMKISNCIDNSELLSNINEHYIRALKYLDEIDVYNSINN